MAALVEGTGFEVVGVETAGVVSRINIRTIDTVDNEDTIAIDLTKYGISATGLRSVTGYIHTTANSVMVAEAPTTAVSSGTLTITVGGSTDNKQRYYEVVGFSTPNPSSSL
jgi:hypothetical protein